MLPFGAELLYLWVAGIALELTFLSGGWGTGLCPRVGFRAEGQEREKENVDKDLPRGLPPPSRSFLPDAANVIDFYSMTKSSSEGGLATPSSPRMLPLMPSPVV